MTVTNNEVFEPPVDSRVRVYATACEWRLDIEIDSGAVAHARVHSTRPRIALGPIPVAATDDILDVAVKVLEAAHDHEG